MPLRKDLGFVHQATGLRIELHWRLFLNPHAMAETSIMAAVACRASGRNGRTAHAGRGRSLRLSLHARRPALVEPAQMAWPMLTPCLLPRRRTVLSASSAPPKQGARGAPPRRPCCFAGTSSGALTRFTDGHAGEESHGALAGGDGAERDDHRPRRAGSARSAIRDDPRQPLDLSSQPQLALSVGRAGSSADKPN